MVYHVVEMSIADKETVISCIVLLHKVDCSCHGLVWRGANLCAAYTRWKADHVHNVYLTWHLMIRPVQRDQERWRNSDALRNDVSVTQKSFGLNIPFRARLDLRK